MGVCCYNNNTNPYIMTDLPTFHVIWDENPNIIDSNLSTNTEDIQEMSFEEFEAMYGFDVSALDAQSHTNAPDELILTLDLPEHEQMNSEMSSTNINDDQSMTNQPAADNISPTSQISGEQLETNEFLDINPDGVRTLIEAEENKSTKKKTVSDISKFARFLALKGEKKPVHEIEVDILDEYVANFILSCKTRTGEDYEPSSIRNIISSLDRTLRKHKYPYSIMNSSGPQFSLSRDAFTAKKKSLKKKGRGNKPNAASPLTDEEIEVLYEKRLLGDATPKALLNTVWLNNVIHFGQRGTTEQYNLRWGDVKLKKSADGTEYLELNERQSKTRTGENIEDVRTVTPKMYATSSGRNPLDMYKSYAAKRPKAFSKDDDPFYIATRTTPLPDDGTGAPWFISQRVGVKKLSGLLKRMATEAGLTDKRLTNHSTRKHLVQKLRDENVPPTDIMAVTGHANVQSILNYSHISEEKQKYCSNLLSATRPAPKATSTVTRPTESVRSESVQDVSVFQTSHPVSLPSGSPVAVQDQPHPTHSQNIFASRQSFNSQFYGAVFNVQNFNVYNSNQ